jgi:ankyrin repeat protein
VTLDSFERTELHYAALENSLEKTRAALSAGIDCDCADSQGFTPLHFAAQGRAADVARLLLDQGAAVDSTNKFGNTPLFVAVFNSKGDGSVVELLRVCGADPYRTNNSGQTPLGLARLIANYDVARFFADLPINS